VKISQNFTTTFLQAVIFHYSLNLCEQSSPTFEQGTAFPPDKHCPSVATRVWHSAVPHHWHNCVLSRFLSFCLSENQHRWDQDWRVDVATLSIQNLWWCLWCGHLCAVLYCNRGLTFQTFFLWDSFNEDEHSDLLQFQYSIAPPWQYHPTHKCAHHEGHHKVMLDSAVASTLQSWTHLFGPLKVRLWGHY